MPEEMTVDEWFEYTLRNFLRALEVMTLEPIEQCQVWGNYNVAWELVTDLKNDGADIQELACSYLSPVEKQAVAVFLDCFRDVPDAILVSATSIKANQVAMSHPCWAPLRKRAANLLLRLESASIRNRSYFLAQ